MAKDLTPEDLLTDPSTPWWARDVILVALQKDAVDAANVFEVLAAVFGLRARRLLTSGLEHGGAP